jgi:hypothetical protein
MTRRTMIVSTAASLLPGDLPGQALTADEAEIPTDNPDTVLRCMTTTKGKLMVGIRTKVAADYALITVFYNEKLFIRGSVWPERVPVDLLLSRESVAPVAGWNGYGGTRDDFDIPRKMIRFFRVTFMNYAGTRETAKV